ncbi:MAG: ankyrin repeat domain-containing protein [Candidatus Dependentiae bacterium]|nr:ankyrin repeat domain-containing protein [Candidatus Dependentiae bacterium]
MIKMILKGFCYTSAALFSLLFAGHMSAMIPSPSLSRTPAFACFTNFLQSLPMAKCFSTNLNFLKKDATTEGAVGDAENADSWAEFKLSPTMCLKSSYEKSTNSLKKEQTKKFFSQGALAPEKVAPALRKLVDAMRAGSVTSGACTLTFKGGPITLLISVTLEQEEPALFSIVLRLSYNGDDIGKRIMPILFETGVKDGKPCEQVSMQPGYLDVSSRYRQLGLGGYLLQLQNEFLKLYPWAIGVLMPYPYQLLQDDDSDKMLPVLERYYASFGFVGHPEKKGHMIIAFNDGKLDKKIELLRAMEKNDTTEVAQLVKNGLKIDEKLGKISLHRTILKYAVQYSNLELLKTLLSQGKKELAAEVINLAMSYDKIEVIDLLLESGFVNKEYDGYLLGFAMYKSHAGLVKKMLKRGVLETGKNLPLVYRLLSMCNPETRKLLETEMAARKEIKA